MTGDFSESADPISLFSQWLGEAEASEPDDPNAMALATVDPDGLPNVRMVLLKGHDPDGFVFYTNKESAKGIELAANGQAAVCFHWKSLSRQVRIRGAVEEVARAEADAYFASRPRLSRLGAWASQQSRPLETHLALERAAAAMMAKYPVGAIPRPGYWSGFRIRPEQIEFWKAGAFRLHQRIVFRRDKADAWHGQRLYP